MKVKSPDEYMSESPAKKGKVDGEGEQIEEKEQSGVNVQETMSDEKMETREAVEETEHSEKKITADDVQDLEIEADGDLDDGEEGMDQFDADHMMAVDEVGGSDDEDCDNTLLGEGEKKDEEVITAVEEEKPLTQEGKENVVPEENTDKELKCGTGAYHQEDKMVKGKEGGGDSTPGRAAADSAIKMDTSQDRKDDDLSRIVHVDESQNDLNSDLTGKGSEEGDSSAGATIKAAAVDSSANVQLTSVADAVAPNADSEEAAPADKMAEEEATTDGGGPDAGAPKPAPTASEEGREKTGEGQAEKDTAAASAAASVNKINTSVASKEDKPKSIATVKPAVMEKDKKASANSCSLWISGLDNSIKAGDLKTLFTKYGKVTGAKIFTNTKDPGSKCYGFVTMSQAEEASKCIQHLHRTELHGKIISVDRAKSDPTAKKLETKPAPKKEAGSLKKEEQKKEDEKEKKEQVTKEKKPRYDDRRGSYGDQRRGNFRGRYGRGRGGRYGGRSNYRRDQQDRSGRKDRDREGEKKDGDTPSKEDGDKDKVTPSKIGSKEKDVLTLDKIKEAKEVRRLRQRERRMRQEERRRTWELEQERERQREIEQRQRNEHVRLQRERERLRMEKEKLEREKVEAERERFHLERERRERERQELMQKRRIEAQRSEKQQRSRKRPYEGPRGSGGRDDSWDQPKRANFGGPQGGANFDRDRSGYDDKRGNSNPEWRVERNDRRAGRPIESHRDEPARHDRGGGDRNDVPSPRESAEGGRRDSRPMPREPPTRERDDRTRNAERYDTRRDQQRDDRGGHGNMRNERRQSPGRRNQQQPRNDHPQQREGAGNDRYQDSGTRGRANAPGSASNQSGWHGNRDNRQGQHNTGSSQSHVSDGGGRWPVSNNPQPSSRPTMAFKSTPLLQAPPAANTFLASAANIMMGVGLANRGGQQDNRYDAYSRGIPGGQVRKY